MSPQPVYRAFLATSLEQIEAAQALRHEIYVRRMNLVPESHPFVQGRRLVDPYDTYSHHLLLTADDVLVGTARFTLASEGPLEIEECVALGDRCGDRAGLAEVTRLMVLREFRCWEATRALFWGIWKAFEALDIERVLAAGKLGSLGQYYRNFGLSLVDPEPFEYPLIPGCKYQLLLGNFGRLPSVRRQAWRSFFGTSYLGAHLLPGLCSSLYRRGLRGRARHQSAPTRHSQPVRGAA